MIIYYYLCNAKIMFNQSNNPAMRIILLILSVILFVGTAVGIVAHAILGHIVTVGAWLFVLFTLCATGYLLLVAVNEALPNRDDE